MLYEKQLIYNGKYYKENELVLERNNRAFLYGDSIFETIYASENVLHFLDEHLSRLVSGMKVLKYNIPDKFFPAKKIIEKEISSLLLKNKYFGGVRIRITVFGKSGGYYTPKTNDIEYIIETSPLDNKLYLLSKKTLTIDVFNEITKPVNQFSQYKTGNSLLLVVAGRYSKEKNLDDCIILNEKYNICETISSNIFFVLGKNIITPSLSSGCVSGIMRKNIMKIAANENYYVLEKHSIKIDDLKSFDEIFLTNSISGIRAVNAYKDKRYFNKTAKFLIEKLNQITGSK